MATEIQGANYDANYIAEFSKRRNEPEWFTDLRKKGLELSESLPMPQPEKTRIVGWNFTEFEHEVDYTPITSPEDLPQHVSRLVGQGEQSGNLLVLQNGKNAYTQLSEDLKNKGVIFTDLETALREHGDLVKKYYFTEAADYDTDRLTALHAALVNSGVFLYVPKNVEVDVPLQALSWQENPNAGLISHTIIVADQGSSVTYVENFLSDKKDGRAVANIIAEIYVGDNAKVQFGAVDNLAKDVTAYVNRRGYVGRHGQLEWALGQMNDGNTLSETYTALVGEGAVTNTKAVSIGNGEQKQNFTNHIKHFGKYTESDMLIHGVQREGASAIFNGVTKIEHGASKSDGEQTQRVLMLSSDARGDANPILLIDEDDVVAGHAASVGRIDPVQLYYLMSRGISEHEAERLVIHGFLEPVVSQLPVEGVKQQLVEVIEGKVK
ncbi:Fe-S cluster assembly protein SufD [Pullulanibacillus pueri]|uniref:FeS cluster assembly protein SufD n=1 Tax=Pullulanibacillus pueri TaxID=1437324 RepID=A0A8J2ZSR0_9BACL|nr:Fe-S cluster assembly protein SufD [Pullulanibacillus pueri]MBM7680411.1 Fe-S cluster assembly protein SufD [Pullulanibacillus pueri]GGH75211.1 FeS cluster assembly protein SufD [Pullulanibacillus pueri]